MQTAGATSEIGEKIRGIQDTTQGTIKQIDTIFQCFGTLRSGGKVRRFKLNNGA